MVCNGLHKKSSILSRISWLFFLVFHGCLSTLHRVSPSFTVSIGWPIVFSRAYLVDDLVGVLLRARIGGPREQQVGDGGDALGAGSGHGGRQVQHGQWPRGDVGRGRPRGHVARQRLDQHRIGAARLQALVEHGDARLVAAHDDRRRPARPHRHVVPVELAHTCTRTTNQNENIKTHKKKKQEAHVTPPVI